MQRALDRRLRRRARESIDEKDFRTEKNLHRRALVSLLRVQKHAKLQFFPREIDWISTQKYPPSRINSLRKQVSTDGMLSGSPLILKRNQRKHPDSKFISFPQRRGRANVNEMRIAQHSAAMAERILIDDARLPAETSPEVRAPHNLRNHPRCHRLCNFKQFVISRVVSTRGRIFPNSTDATVALHGLSPSVAPA